MNIYIPIVPILWVIAFYVAVGILLYVPLDFLVSRRLNSMNIRQRKVSLAISVERAVKNPMDTFKYLLVWPYVLVDILRRM